MADDTEKGKPPVVGHPCVTYGVWYLFASRALACRLGHIPAMQLEGAIRRRAYEAHRRRWKAEFRELQGLGPETPVRSPGSQ